jgi:hypothetical protein
MRALKRHNVSPTLFVKSALRDTELRHDEAGFIPTCFWNADFPSLPSVSSDCVRVIIRCRFSVTSRTPFSGQTSSCSKNRQLFV